MAPHLTFAELDFLQEKQRAGKTPIQIHSLLVSQRKRKGIEAPHLTKLRKALKGKTYKRSATETRGRKQLLSRRMVLKMNAVRKTILKKRPDKELHWSDLVKAARAPKVDRTTVKKAFAREKIPVAARRPREKPQRSEEHRAERVVIGAKLAKKPKKFYSKKVDLIIDNKHFDTPTHDRAREYLKEQHVRFHLRTPSEGLDPECTKRSRKKNRYNCGGSANVCAGISNGRIVMWEYLPKKWNGQVAADLYEGAIITTLRKERGEKRKYLILEDNDPVGYKSNKGKAAKSNMHIEVLEYPRYSPDLNPLDYSLWLQIEGETLKNSPKGKETVEAYKARLRTTALRFPKAAVVKAVEALPRRAQAVVDAKGGNIPRD